jgi:hypothetical protein
VRDANLCSAQGAGMMNELDTEALDRSLAGPGKRFTSASLGGMLALMCVNLLKPPQRTILVVDGDVSVLSVIKCMLESGDYRSGPTIRCPTPFFRRSTSDRILFISDTISHRQATLDYFQMG